MRGATFKLGIERSGGWAVVAVVGASTRGPLSMPLPCESRAKGVLLSLREQGGLCSPRVMGSVIACLAAALPVRGCCAGVEAVAPWASRPELVWLVLAQLGPVAVLTDGQLGVFGTTLVEVSVLCLLDDGCGAVVKAVAPWVCRSRLLVCSAPSWWDVSVCSWRVRANACLLGS